MKKRIISVVAILLVALLAVGYHFSFPIPSDMGNFDATLRGWLNRGRTQADVQRELALYDSVTLGKRTYVAMELDEEIGYVLLEKGITGRYKIEGTSHGNVNFCNGVVSADGQKHLLFIGRNTFGEIAKVKFHLSDNDEYEMDIPRQKVFLQHIEVADDVETGPVSFEDIGFFDSKGNDIAEKLDLSGGSIK